MMYDYVMFILFVNYWIVGKVGGRWECDDFVFNLVLKDFWRIFVWLF